MQTPLESLCGRIVTDSGGQDHGDQDTESGPRASRIHASHPGPEDRYPRRGCRKGETSIFRNDGPSEFVVQAYRHRVGALGGIGELAFGVSGLPGRL